MRLLATVIGLCEAAATATARGRRREDEGLAGGGRAEGAADRVVGGGRGASEEREVRRPNHDGRGRDKAPKGENLGLRRR
jgi:hypothetical protein